MICEICGEIDAWVERWKNDFDYPVCTLCNDKLQEALPDDAKEMFSAAHSYRPLLEKYKLLTKPPPSDEEMADAARKLQQNVKELMNG